MATSQIRPNSFAAAIGLLTKRKRDEEVMSQPPIRVNDVAVTDSLPPVQPQGFSTPDAGYRNAVQPTNNLSSPPTITATNNAPPPVPQIQTAPIINKSLFDARAATSPVMPTPSINTNQVIGRNPFADTQPSLADKYMAAAQPYEEPSSVPVSAAIRPRITQSIDPLQRAAENAVVPVLPDFGQDKEGNQRTHAKRGVVGRAIAFAKDLGLNMLEGRGLIASAADATHAAINPDILAQRRAKAQTAENQGELATQLGIAGEQARIGQIRAQTQRASQPKVYHTRNAQGQPIRVEENPAGGEPKVTILDKSTKTTAPHTDWVDDRLKVWNPDTRRYDDALDTNGQPITSALRQPVDYTVDGETYTVTPTAALNARSMNERFNITKKMEVDRTNNQYDIDEQEWNRKEADRVAKEQADADEANQANAIIDRQNVELKKQQDAAYAIANDPNRPAWEQVAARKSAEGLMKRIGENEQKRKPVKSVTPAQPFKRPQLTVPQGGGVSRAPQGRVAPTSGIIRYQ